ncbi:MAG: hypothetical protein KJ049_05175 [Gammaproteobacteria bacterium]|nr:hypothetical protein [Gammaproteobacteria bacterium]
MARSNDEAVRDAHVVAGLRFWFWAERAKTCR